MRYPVLINADFDLAAFDVAIPDLPGCFAAGDSMEEAMARAVDAAIAWIMSARSAGRPIPAPSPHTLISRMPDYADWTLGMIHVDPARIDDGPEEIRLTLPKSVLRRLTNLATARRQSLDAVIADLARQAG